MKLRTFRPLIAAVMLLPLAGCLVISDRDHDYDKQDHQSIEHRNRDAIAGLATGVSSTMVIEKLGTPDFDDQLTDGHRVLFYRTQRKHSDGMTTRDECTPLIFSDGKLVGWGQLALNKL